MSLVLTVVQEGFEPGLKDDMREREGLRCVRVEGRGVPASSGMTSFHLGRVYLIRCIEKEVGSG